MSKLKRTLLLTICLMSLANSCLAEENTLKSIFQDIFYGGLSGGLVGAAILAFTRQPGRHLDYIGYGAAGGALIGATYGAVSSTWSTKSLAELKDGEFTFSIPTIIPEIREGNPKGRPAVVAIAELVRGTF